MSVQRTNPRTVLNRNRFVVKAQELMHGTHRSQQRELVNQQNLILIEQNRRIRQRKAQNVAQTQSATHDTKHDGDDLIADSIPEDVPEAVPETKAAKPMPQAKAQFPSIFVSIASYRDKECLPTVQDLFAKAEHPNRVFVGVYEQNDPETDQSITLSHLLEHDPTKIPDLVARWNDGQLRVMMTPAVDAKGPMYARALIEQNLFQNEDFYMIIDSHSLFERKWDSLCLNEWTKASKQSPKPVLSYYPSNFDLGKRAQTPLQQNPRVKMYYARLLKFDKNCGFPLATKELFVNMPREPIRSLFWMAGFSFASSSMIAEVPFDNNYPYLFLGEEMSMNLRLFTHGYDVFNPSQHILYHIEDREYRPTFWELFYVHRKPKSASFTVSDGDRDARKNQMDASVQRMAQLLYNHPEHGVALGKVRTYAQFCDFIGINFEKQIAEAHTTLGRTKRPSKDETFAKMAGAQAAMPTTALPKSVQQQPRPMMQKSMKPTPMTKMTGLTGGGMVSNQQPPKQIPRTRMPQFRGPSATPQPRAYAKGIWGKVT